MNKKISLWLSFVISILLGGFFIIHIPYKNEIFKKETLPVTSEFESKIQTKTESFIRPLPQQVANAPRVPVTITIPKIRVSAPIEPVGLDTEGRMDTLPDAAKIGWYKYGSIPGEQGNSILAGHRDWKRELGSFYNLNRLAAGDLVEIYFSDESQEMFEVLSVHSYHLGDVPEQVMHLDGEERTTLITCSGKFIKDKGGYQDRTIVLLKQRTSNNLR